MKFKQYPEYKESGLPWIGKIPAHWECLRGKWIFEKRERVVRASDEVVTCFRDGVVTLRKNRRIRGFTESLKEIGYQGIRKGDLVIHQMDAFAGAIGVSDSDGKGTPVYSVCKSKGDYDTHYYSQVLREMAKSGFILSLAKGIRERSTDFRFETFTRQTLPVPPFEEQKAIAAFIRAKEKKIAKFIRNKLRLIQLLKEQKQVIINQAVTRGIDPDVKMKPSGVDWLEDIPEHWKKIALRRCCITVKTGTTPSGADEKYYSDNGLNWYTPGDFSDDLFLGRSIRQLSQLGETEVKIFPPNTIMIIGIGGTIGKVCISKEAASCNQQINAIIVKPHVDVEFLTYYLRTLREFITKCGKFTTLPIINQDETKDLIVLLPDLKEQINIVLHIKKRTQKINESILKTEQEIKLIQEYRTRLISDVVTGKVDVRNIKVEDVAEEELLEDVSNVEETPAYAEASADREELEDSIENGK